jgi:plastocyanin
MVGHGPHSTTSGSRWHPTGIWDSGLVLFQYSHTFPQAGTFHYFCRAHYETGTVIVDP